jgi:hypothetical protein
VWLAIRLDLLGAVGVAVATSLAVFGSVQETLAAGLVGLCVVYAMQLTARLNSVVTSVADVEAAMVRILRQFFQKCST